VSPHNRSAGRTEKTVSLRRNILSLFVLQGISYLAPLATLPYLVRVLGPDKFGLLAFAQATIQFFVILTEYGFNLSANRQVSIHRNDPERLRTIFWSTLSIKFLLMTTGFMILLGLVFSADRFRAEWSVYVIMYLMVVGYALLPAWYLQGREMMRHVAGMHVAATLISVSAIFLFVHDERDYLLTALIQSSTLVIAAIIGLVMVWKAAPVAPTIPRIADIHAAIRDGWEVFVSTLATSLYTSSNVLVLGFLSGNVAVGYFSAADKITRAVQGMFTPITLAMYPRINALALCCAWARQIIATSAASSSRMS
jgi:PST family polysaccharide transporter